MNLNFFIAKRLFTGKEEKKKISLPAIRIAIAGVAIGLVVMIVTVCVVLGFKHCIQRKVSSMGGDIQVTSFKAYQMGDNTPVAVNDSLLRAMSSVPNVEEIRVYADVQGILKTDSDLMGIQFRGMQTATDRQQGRELADNTLIVSKMIANTLSLDTAQRVFAYFIGESVRTRRFAIDSIYETNLAMYDKTLCFIPISTAQKLNSWETDQASGMQILTANPEENHETARLINQRLKNITDKYGQQYCVRTIKEVHPGIFAWIELLDVNVWIILALMVCVAGITMISGLLIIILERTQMIGLLKALGARNGSVRHTFLWLAAMITGKGMLWGNIVGLAIVLLQQWTGVIKLDPANYYVDTVPMEINILLLVGLNIATFILCSLMLIIPSHLITHISPSRSMRYE